VQAFRESGIGFSAVAARPSGTAIDRGAEGDKFMASIRLGYSMNNHRLSAPVGHQSASVDLAAETYGMASPRPAPSLQTDEKRLRDMGLIRGAGPESIIIRSRRARERPCAFADEYVRTRYWT